MLLQMALFYSPMANIPLYMYVYIYIYIYKLIYIFHIFFVQSSVDGHSGCFHVLDMNIGVHIASQIRISWS